MVLGRCFLRRVHNNKLCRISCVLPLVKVRISDRLGLSTVFTSVSRPAQFLDNQLVPPSEGQPRTYQQHGAGDGRREVT